MLTNALSDVLDTRIQIRYSQISGPLGALYRVNMKIQELQ